jgi:SRSO17 transposase
MGRPDTIRLRNFELRRREAGVPNVAVFHTKPRLAQQMLERAFAAGVPAAWVTGDEVYGNDGGFRRWLEGEERAYVLAVARSHMVWGEGFVQRRVEALVADLPAEAWHRIEIGAGSKGPRVYDWACGRLPYLTTEGWAQWLLVRRSLADPADLAFYRVSAPANTPLAELARIAGTRWSIEEGFERAKGDVGLDQYEVRRWDAWYRHITRCLLAHAFLEVTRAAANQRRGGKGATDDLIPLTAPEVRRLLLVLTLPAAQRQHRLHWSRWRRTRQAQARRSHCRRRARDALH